MTVGYGPHVNKLNLFGGTLFRQSEKGGSVVSLAMWLEANVAFLLPPRPQQNNLF